MGEQVYNYDFCPNCKLFGMPKVKGDLYVTARRCYNCGTVQEIDVKIIDGKASFIFR